MGEYLIWLKSSAPHEVKKISTLHRHRVIFFPQAGEAIAIRKLGKNYWATRQILMLLF